MHPDHDAGMLLSVEQKPMKIGPGAMRSCGSHRPPRLEACVNHLEGPLLGSRKRIGRIGQPCPGTTNRSWGEFLRVQVIPIVGKSSMHIAGRKMTVVEAGWPLFVDFQIECLRKGVFIFASGLEADRIIKFGRIVDSNLSWKARQSGFNC